MSKHSVSKAMGLSNVKPVAELLKERHCPHPYCKVKMTGTRAEFRQHYRDAHKCGDCNRERHDKCKGNVGFCGCKCREKGGEGNNERVVLDATMKLALATLKAV